MKIVGVVNVVQASVIEASATTVNSMDIWHMNVRTLVFHVSMDNSFQ